MVPLEIKDEIEICRHLYDREVARRDTIRTTLGVPLAALSFAAFGFGALVSQVILDDITPTSLAVLAMILFYALVALCLFFRAVRQVFAFDYTSFVSVPQVFDLKTQRQTLAAAIGSLHLPEPERVVEEGVQNAVAEEYKAKARKLSAKNDANLIIQKHLLETIMLGLGCLILAIFLALCLKIVTAV